VHVTNPELFEAMVDIDLAEVCITSAATLANGEGPADAFRMPELRAMTRESAASDDVPTPNEMLNASCPLTTK